MNRKALRTSLFWALTGGGVLAVVTGQNQAVSLRIWLSAFTAWFAWQALKHLIADIPLAPTPLRPLPFFPERQKPEPSARLRELRSLDVLLWRSGANERSYVQQLRPRLVMLADHFLPVNHGIDRDRQPDRAEELLGPVAWLLDPTINDRRPSLAELATFVDLLIPEPTTSVT